MFVFKRLALSLLMLNWVWFAQAQELELQVSSPSFAPFSHFNENPTCVGTTQKILNDLAQKVGFKASNELYPYARILKALESGQLDVALIFKNDTVSQSVEYIGPIATSKVFILTTDKKLITEYEDLYQLKAIAVIRNASFEPRFDNDQQLNKVPVATYAQAVEMFKANRVDAIVGSEVGLEYALFHKIPNSQALKEQSFLLGKKEWWIHLAKKSKHIELADELRNATAQLYGERLIYKTYKALHQKCQKVQAQPLNQSLYASFIFDQ